MVSTVAKTKNFVASTEETDEDLLVSVSMAEDEPELAMVAWDQFYRRHVKYLYVCCRRYAGQLGGESGVDDLVQDTFFRVYKHAGTFDGNGLKVSSQLRQRVRAWMGKIAHNLLCSRLQGQVEEYVGSFNDLELLRQREGIESEQAPLSTAPSALLDLMDSVLSEKEQEVLRVTIFYYQPGRAHQRLPDGIAAGLAETLRTTPENIRQIRKRAYQKLKVALSTPNETPD